MDCDIVRPRRDRTGGAKPDGELHTIPLLELDKQPLLRKAGMDGTDHVLSLARYRESEAAARVGNRLSPALSCELDLDSGKRLEAGISHGTVDRDPSCLDLQRGEHLRCGMKDVVVLPAPGSDGNG